MEGYGRLWKVEGCSRPHEGGLKARGEGEGGAPSVGQPLQPSGLGCYPRIRLFTLLLFTLLLFTLLLFTLLLFTLLLFTLLHHR